MHKRSYTGLGDVQGTEYDVAATFQLSGDDYNTDYSMVGDVSGDGWADFVFTTRQGVAYLVLGGSNISSPVQVPGDPTVVTFTSSSALSASLLLRPAQNLIGDVNGDNITDFMLVGGNKAFLIYGGAHLNGTIDLDSIVTSQIFVFTASGEGLFNGAIADFNKDGRPDFLLSAVFSNSLKGGAYLVYGQLLWTSPVDITTLSPTECVKFTAAGFDGFVVGKVAQVIGDVDNDGFLDFVLGNSLHKTNLGILFLVYGSADYSNSKTLLQSATRINSSASYYVGNSVVRLGDFNKDGYDDWAISSPATKKQTSYVYLIYGSSTRLGASLDLSTGVGMTIFASNAFNQGTGLSVHDGLLPQTSQETELLTYLCQMGTRRTI